ncbi:cyclopropane-fatty-acyl-phospholipid synthase family protein [Rhodoblastus sp.]|uniref:SAM-dependent methyltransferase n=1 Tax=Rhodoblastus sp. TaxID=1962975 RepID=UPI00262ABE1B|nr:cyclopropane-fatty-acyl-phospholipid synthase family protein [Rhodoblastus sp.]
MKSQTLVLTGQKKANLFVHPLALALRPWLDRIAHGALSLRLPSGDLFEARGGLGPEASLTLHDWSALRRLLLQGGIGFAQGFVAGEWTTPDLVALLRFGALNAPALAGLSGNPAHRLFNRARHRLRGNTRRGSRRNIVSHYDLGNDFFSLWLDPTLLYSSAWFEDGAETLEQAQEDRLARMVALLDLRGGERILEIGCGWGALALRLARSGAGAVTGLTLSSAQLAFAQRRCAGARVDLRLQDYRDVAGTFDRVVSIEMIEAVGEAYWPAYFGKIAQVLRPGGTALIQAITIDERRFRAYRVQPDFIQRHIFPGGFLPTRTAIAEQAARAGLELIRAEPFGGSYARTLAEWRARFEARRSEIAALGFDEKFRRLWTYYLCYCEAGFREGVTDVGFYLLQKPGI